MSDDPAHPDDSSSSHLGSHGSPPYAETNPDQQHPNALRTQNGNHLEGTEDSEAITEVENADASESVDKSHPSINPGPSNSPSTPDADSIERCHPCPYYEGQFHHRCEGNCHGLAVKELRTPSVDEEAFFNGSLWECEAPKRWHRVENEIHSFREFIAKYRWAPVNGGLVSRVFGLSNGAMIRIRRAHRGDVLEFNFYQAPRQPWARSRLDWTEIPREQFLEQLPQDTHYIQALRPGRLQYTATDYNRWTHIDDLRSPEWQTDTVFTIHFDDPQRDPLRVRLERAAASPRERLVTHNTVFLRLNANPGPVPTGVPSGDRAWQGPGVPRATGAPSATEGQQANQPEHTHIRDYDAPNFPDLDEAIRHAAPGSAQLKGFQERLAKAKAKKEQKKRDEEAQKQQAQQNTGAPDAAAPSEPSASATALNANTVVNSHPQQIETNPNSQVATNLAFLLGLRNPTVASTTTTAPSGSVLAASGQVVVNVPVVDPAMNPALAISQPLIPSRASQEPTNQTKVQDNNDNAGARGQKAGAESGVKKANKGNESTGQPRMTTRLQALAKAKKEKEEEEKEKEAKEKDKDKKMKAKAGDDKANGKGKNKRPADDDSEDADDEAGAIAAPPPKKGRKTVRATGVSSPKKQEPRKKR